MSLSKNNIKWLKTLHLKKYRQKYNNFIAEGDKIVSELLQQPKYVVHQIYALASWIDQNEAILQKSEVKYQAINERELKLISQLKTPNKTLAVVNIPTIIDIDGVGFKKSLKSNWSLFLDGLQDPGNVGTILRIADWFAIPNVLFGPGTVDLYNSKVLQASMGAFLRVKCSSLDYTQLYSLSEEVSICLADMGGQNVFDFTPPIAGILAIGNEGQGISNSIREMNPQCLSIISPNGGAESLNAAVATGIICAAIRR